MANGKVCTGFSMPWVALYAANAGVVSYSGGIPLARGVDVRMDVEGSSDNNFYADNVLAESDTQAFSSGTLTLTVDGLKEAARKLISGVTRTQSVTVEQASVNFDVYDDLAVVPYVGIGFVVRYMENGVTTWCPVVINKCKFSPDSLEAATQEENIEFQTSSLEAEIFRDDSTNHAWKMIGADQTSEAAAYVAIKAILTPAAAAAQNASNSTRSVKG